MKKFTWISLGLFCFSQLTHGAPRIALHPTKAMTALQSPYPCDLVGIRSISLPLYPERPNSPRFNFKYQVVGTLRANSPAVVFLPGGPGQSSIDDFSDPQVTQNMIASGLPANIPWIFFDPRTVGCNRGDSTVFPDDSLTTDYISGDVVAVIRALGLKKYVLFGHSYGSQWATVVGGRTGSGEAQNPSAVILSGVWGRGVNGETYGSLHNVSEQWRNIKSLLPERALNTLAENSPLGFDSNTWWSFLLEGLYQGYRTKSGKFSNQLLDDLLELTWQDPNQQSQLRSDLKTTVDPTVMPIRPDFSYRLFVKIACHEMSPHEEVSPNFEKGEFVSNPADTPCKDEMFDRPYDAATSVITAPLYYIAGDHDPAAPWLGALYHVQVETQSRRNFVRVPGGGHSTLGDIFPDCKDRLWKAVWEGKDWDKPLQKCVAPVELQVIGAQAAAARLGSSFF